MVFRRNSENSSGFLTKHRNSRILGLSFLPRKSQANFKQFKGTNISKQNRFKAHQIEQGVSK